MRTDFVIFYIPAMYFISKACQLTSRFVYFLTTTFVVEFLRGMVLYVVFTRVLKEELALKDMSAAA